ncbi:MAG: hypothetical protein MZV49_23300 [Rhodopseudomonas palustris]|nr:hypothetical protein [Rhodopseudomonas palustris]
MFERVCETGSALDASGRGCSAAGAAAAGGEQGKRDHAGRNRCRAALRTSRHAVQQLLIDAGNYRSAAPGGNPDPDNLPQLVTIH